MRNFPKRLATATDIRNCKKLVDNGTFEASQLLSEIEHLENMNYLHCPIQAVSADKKTVTIMYCAEAKADTKAVIGGKTVTITAVIHTEGENEQGEKQYESTSLTLSSEIDESATMVDVTAPYSIYDSLGITADELKQIKEGLVNE